MPIDRTTYTLPPRDYSEGFEIKGALLIFDEYFWDIVTKSLNLVFQAQKRELDAIRTAYRKTSLARSPGSPASAGATAAGNTGPFVFVSSETGGGPGAGGLGGSDDEEDEVGGMISQRLCVTSKGICVNFGSSLNLEA